MHLKRIIIVRARSGAARPAVLLRDTQESGFQTAEAEIIAFAEPGARQRMLPGATIGRSFLNRRSPLKT
jgi:hypothetical protein